MTISKIAVIWAGCTTKRFLRGLCDLEAVQAAFFLFSDDKNVRRESTGFLPH